MAMRGLRRSDEACGPDASPVVSWMKPERPGLCPLPRERRRDAGKDGVGMGGKPSRVGSDLCRWQPSRVAVTRITVDAWLKDGR